VHKLAMLQADAHSADHVVARDTDSIITWAQFLAEVAVLRKEFVQRDNTAFALYHSDSYRFAVGLFALLAAGKSVYLPAENHLAMVSSLLGEGVALAGEFAGGDSIPLERESAIAGVTENAVIDQLHLTGAIVVYTSGSTGDAKPIPKSLAQIDAELAALEWCWGEEMGEAVIAATVSHQHIYGLLFVVLWPICAGRSFWRRPFVDPAIMAGTLAEQSRAAWIMSPAHLHRLDEQMPWDRVRNATALVFSSGGPLDQRAAQRMHDGLGQYPIEVLGSSETGGIAWRHQQRLGQPWQPLPGVDVRFDNGSLAVRSAWLADDEWLLTADQATPDGAGGFALGVRSDRIVKVEGKRVSLPAVESALRENPLVEDCAVLVLQRRRQMLGALVELSATGAEYYAAQGHHRFTRELRRFLVTRLAAAAMPRIWRMVDPLPRNPQGKVLQKELQAHFSDAGLPVVLSREELGPGRCRLLLQVRPDSPYFEGHFDKVGIVAGVVQLHWAELLARRYLNLQGDFCGMKSLKFKDLIFASAQLTLDMAYSVESGGLEFHFQSENGRHSEGTLLYHV
jgi:acyl-CoA synthetase (AMP-forming)/AMP-acid ligase II